MDNNINTFQSTLKEHDLKLLRGETSTLQINTGLLCNQVCKHCHLSAGPSKTESMIRKTMDEIAGFASINSFNTIDITGGAPEMNHDIVYMIEKFKDLAPEVIIRSNLSALSEFEDDSLIECLKESKINITASFPSVNEKQTNAQRGNGIFITSVKMLQKLNCIGYGIEGSGLTLNLVSNPSGAFMPVPQSEAEKRFRSVLNEKWGIKFTNLYSFTNVPLGRYQDWLKSSGNYETYIKKLIDSFNPEAVQNLMCRNLISVSWDGYVYDCDFNLAKELYAGEERTHITEIDKPFAYGTEISTDNHCYSCTAGAGFT